MNMNQLPEDYLEKIIDSALVEDTGRGDITMTVRQQALEKKLDKMEGK